MLKVRQINSISLDVEHIVGKLKFHVSGVKRQTNLRKQ